MTEHILYILLYIHRTDTEVHLLLIQIYSSKACHITNVMYTNAVLVFRSTETALPPHTHKHKYKTFK